jgi:hypothetical protein
MSAGFTRKRMMTFPAVELLSGTGRREVSQKYTESEPSPAACSSSITEVQNICQTNCFSYPRKNSLDIGTPQHTPPTT